MTPIHESDHMWSSWVGVMEKGTLGIGRTVSNDPLELGWLS